MKSLPEQNRPQTTKSLALEEKTIKKIEENIISNTPLLFHGPPGVGKTSTVYAIAKELGLRVIETNASNERRRSDLSQTLKNIQIKGFERVLYLLDEVESIPDFKPIIDILRRNRHPIILITNKLWEIPKDVKERCQTIPFYPVKLKSSGDIVKSIASRVGIAPDFSKVTGDVRASINAAIYGGETYTPSDPFQIVKNLLEKGSLPEDLDFPIYPWLIDNLPRFYYGKDLIDAYEILSESDLKKDISLLRFLPRGRGSVIYPYYLRRRGQLKNRSNDEN